jgi:hypothetical protein
MVFDQYARNFRSFQAQGCLPRHTANTSCGCQHPMSPFLEVALAGRKH